MDFNIFLICVLFTSVTATLPQSTCCDESYNCLYHKARNFCETQSEYMRKYCKFTCGLCEVLVFVGKIKVGIGFVNVTEAERNNSVEYAQYVEDVQELIDNYTNFNKYQRLETPKVRLEGGHDSNLLDVFWFAKINWRQPNNTYTVCAGAAIARRYILTLSHCILDPDKITSKNFQVRISSVHLMNGELIRIEKVYLYEDNKYGTNVERCSKADLALLYTKDLIGTGKAIELSSRNERYGETAQFYGFGIPLIDLNEKGILQSRMQTVNVTIKKVRETNKAHAFFVDGNLQEGALILGTSEKRKLGGLYCGVENLPNGDLVSVFMRSADYLSWISEKMIRHNELRR